VLYALMAALPAAPGSKLVLATSGGSPGWLLGPLRVFGASGADGRLAGPLFYAALWVALLLYVVVLLTARSLGVRLALGAVAAMHLLFLLAPPLLSHDVFSYIAYARLGVANHLNPSRTHQSTSRTTRASRTQARSTRRRPTGRCSRC
jgi:hypothetical protein